MAVMETTHQHRDPMFPLHRNLSTMWVPTCYTVYSSARTEAAKAAFETQIQVRPVIGA